MVVISLKYLHFNFFYIEIKNLKCKYFKIYIKNISKYLIECIRIIKLKL